MKLLLTSAGLTNETIVNALRGMVERPFEELHLAFIPTAANVEVGDKDWLIDDLVNCKKQNFKAVDIVDISAVPKDIWKPRLIDADILLFGGGNTFHLMHWITKSGLQKELNELLKRRIYVGISAGSMVTTKNLALSESAKMYSESIGEIKNDKGIGYVDFHIRPHLNSEWFPKVRTEYLLEQAAELKEPIYAIDDDTAIKVINGEVTVISEGKWEKFN